jgi:hypothetical protein
MPYARIQYFWLFCDVSIATHHRFLGLEKRLRVGPRVLGWQPERISPSRHRELVSEVSVKLVPPGARRSEGSR